MKLDEQGVRAPGVWNGEIFHDPPKKFIEVKFSSWMNKLAQVMSTATGKPI